MVINLWVIWSPPCRREMPMMTEVAATLFIDAGGRLRAAQMDGISRARLLVAIADLAQEAQ